MEDPLARPDLLPPARPGALAPPDFGELAAAAAELGPITERLAAARSDPANAEGGDVTAGGSDRLLARHLANYVAAASLARRLPTAVGTVVDGGSGTGGLAVWAARRLGAPALALVDHDATVRRTAAAAWPGVRTHQSADELPAASAELVTAMEVLEHLHPKEQPRFVTAMARLVAPGGLLVVSTPDEQGYPGGWSAYRPHVGVLDPSELRGLLEDATGWPVAVWRLVGEPFALGRGRRLLEPAANRARTVAVILAQPAVEAVLRATAGHGRRRGHPAIRPVAAIAAGGGPAAARAGSGLLASALRPG